MAPLTKQEVAIDGNRLICYRGGQGTPMLLVHGISTYSFIWRNVVPHLAKHHDVILLDLLGCGDSDKPLDISYSLVDHAQRLVVLLDRLGVDQCHLVGHDLGGGIGQIVGVRHPERLLDLTLVNTVGYNFWPVQPIKAMRTPIVRQLIMAALDAGVMRAIVRRGLYHRDRLNADLLERFMRPMRTRDGRKGFLHFAHCLNNTDLTSIESELRALAVPTLIVRGDHDVYLSEAIALRLVKDIPGAQLVRCPTGGHFIQEDEPEWLAQTVLEWSKAHA